ncbi:UV damage endonuclease UvdE [Emergomyces pasteurianus Ep9510]|uniref:UV damage endonuclease UvdE n=1 Tax=Emergomyces pasteurianus Ep9510 TaxID=1447872 RepID=A0A1J9PKF0_9EURO|nr:UV damage endonuclease UvdE [Emergomyces pasteurianus Ep9510]
MSGFAALHLKYAFQTTACRSQRGPAKQAFVHCLATRHARSVASSQCFPYAPRTPILCQRSTGLIALARRENVSMLHTTSRTVGLTQPVATFPGSLIEEIQRTMSDSSLSDAPIDIDTPVSGPKHVSTGSSKNLATGVFDPEANVDISADIEEVKEALARPPPVNSSYLPLPWKGRLGYACLNTYLRTSKPPVFCARTCRISSILENRHPLQDSTQPAHRTKNRPDLQQPPDVERGLAYVQALGLANARDIVKMIRWNDRYGIRFMRLSSEMFPFASHAEHGYRLEPFAADVLAEAGRVAAELGHRLTVHPGQFTQLASPRSTVTENSVRDLEYHAEMLRLLKLPPQQDRDAVMILHMGGVFGDKQATLDRFRKTYKTLSGDIKNRLVLENDDVSWTVHDLLPICEELNIPLVLDYHHHNINFDADKIREGTLDIMNLYDRITATWTRKGITQKMHYSEQTPSAITKKQRRKHNTRVQMLPPCDPTMDLMIEAKDKEQAVFELMRTYKLPGFEKINDIIPFTRTDDNTSTRGGKAKTKKMTGTRKKSSSSSKLQGAAEANHTNNPNDDEIPSTIIPEEEVGMGGPEGRVYWPPGMEHWLQPEKRATKLETADTIVAKSSSTSVKNAFPATTTTTTTTPRKRGRPSRNADSAAATEFAVEQPATTKRRRTTKADTAFFNSSGSSENETAAKVASRTAVRASRRTKGKKPGPRLRTTFTFLYHLFPQTRQRLRARLLDLRHDILPAFRQRTHLRIYRAIADRQRVRHRHQPPLRRDHAASTAAAIPAINKRKTGLLSYLLSKRRIRKRLEFGHRAKATSTNRSHFTFDSHRNGPLLGAITRRLKDAKGGGRMTTPQSGSLGPYRADSTSDAGSIYGYGSGQDGGGRERGTRRKKVYGYLKAANELRQAYSAQWVQRTQDNDYDTRDTPGEFIDAETARSADEEMVLFPSYGRRHVRKRPEVDYRDLGPESWTDPEDAQSMGDVEFWKKEWEKYEQDNAIVDVDVRGWIYAPHRGPMNRKKRILISLARRLSGIPAPNMVATGNRPSTASVNEDAVVDKQELSIIHTAQRDADPEWRANAGREALSSRPDADQTSYYNNQDEIAAANAQLMERLRPFLTNPIVSVPITVFFFDEKNSQSRTVSTNDGGHFSVRAALDFVPTHIRVLASENLSATEEVKIIEPTGISLISDIDDTIKHSAIASGAKEIFRNTFVRNLADLTVLGVKEWYSKLAELGVRVHYVSNSPWQLYPLLKSYFSLTGLPPGSFHLKQYSGMLQGIFEPSAEKKRPTLERIMLDFPDRRFILVGDSGEADLEVYTELVLANPRKILGIFIRDVTTAPTHNFFDQSVTNFEGLPFRVPATGSSLPENLGEVETCRPSLPPRNYLERKEPAKCEAVIASGDLIDLSIEEEPSTMNKPETAKAPSNNGQIPPTRPCKPAALRSGAVEPDGDNNKRTAPSSIRRKPAPPLPDKPRSLSSSQSRGQSDTPPLSIRSAQTFHPAGPQPLSRATTNQSFNNSSSNNHAVGNAGSYAATARDKVANIYNQLSSTPSYLESIPASNSLSSRDQAPSSQPAAREPPPPLPPPRRSTTQSLSKQSTPMNHVTQYPSGTTQDPRCNISLSPSPSSSLSGTPPPTRTTAANIPSQQSQPSSLYSYPNSSTSSSSIAPGLGPVAATVPVPNKREEMWKRRWARAKEILDRQGVVLMTWRTGEDVENVCVGLVKRAQKEGIEGVR